MKISSTTSRKREAKRFDDKSHLSGWLFELKAEKRKLRILFAALDKKRAKLQNILDKTQVKCYTVSAKQRKAFSAFTKPHRELGQ